MNEQDNKGEAITCPVCDVPLESFSYGGQTIDKCPECKGIWFDPDELRIVAYERIEQGLVEDADIQDAFNAASAACDHDGPVKRCPRCGEHMNVLNYSYDSNVFLDRCGVCAGVWADRGELERICTYLKGNPAVNRYAESIGETQKRAHRKNIVSRLILSRTLSGIVGGIYFLGLIIGAVRSGFSAALLWRFVFLGVCIAGIWFPDTVGEFTGFFFTNPRPITRRSPGIVLAFVCWVTLIVLLLADFGFIYAFMKIIGY